MLSNERHLAAIKSVAFDQDHGKSSSHFYFLFLHMLPIFIIVYDIQPIPNTTPILGSEIMIRPDLLGWLGFCFEVMGCERHVMYTFY
jgi:hypothetical protein